LQQQPPGTSLIPRLGGEFLWKQFHAAANLGIDMAYVAMFDEVDEGTAIFKVSNTPPTQAYFVTYDGLPADWYLRLTAEGSKVLCGERPNTATIPFHHHRRWQSASPPHQPTPTAPRLPSSSRRKRLAEHPPRFHSTLPMINWAR